MILRLSKPERQGVDNMANEYTKNYNLDLYTIDDRPNLLKQYNSAMNKIDDAINTSEKNAMLLNGKNAVVFGDSTAANNPSYFTMLSEKTGMNITNRAIPGTTLTPQGGKAWSQVNASGNDGYSLIKRQTDLANFDIVFLAYSTNDWQSSQRVRNAGMDDGNYISYSAALQKVINYIQSINKNAFIVFVAPAYGYRKWDGTQVNCNSKGFLLRDYAIMAEKIMYENQMGFIDLGNIGVNYNNYTNWLLNDSGGIFVHYNENLKSRIVDYIIGAYPWKPRYIETPEARNISTYRSTYIDSLKICTPLNAADSSNSRKTICYGNKKIADNSLIGNCNASLSGGTLNQIALSENIDFADGFDGLVYVVSMKGDPVIITAENTDYQLKTQAKEFDIAWLAIHVPPTNAAGRLMMTRADTSNNNPIVAICVCEADNVCCSPKQLRHYNLTDLAIADNLAVNYNVFGITDTVHINGVVKKGGVGFKISNACAALANTYDFNNPHNFAHNIYANGCKALLIQLDSAGGLTLFISSVVSNDAGYQWNISI